MLIERRVSATADLDVATSTLSAVFGDVELRRSEHGDTNLTIQSVHSPALTAARWALEGIGAGSLDRYESDAPAILTGVLLRGRMRMYTARQEIDTDRPFLYPEHIDSDLARAELANVTVPVAVLQPYVGAMTAGRDSDVRFTGTAPITPVLDGVWRDTMVYASRTLRTLADLPDSTIASASLIDHVARLLLHTFPNSALDAENAQRTTGSSLPSLRRALQYIEDNLDAPFSAADLADAARLSLRGLHAMFRREIDTTPMAYVRRARLAAARAELQQADPATTDMHRVAARWGFSGLPHFTAAYRRTFDEDPADTVAS